ncbi:hypothetical protein Prudu_1437S000300 [Prunus dulcis]|uniref:Uncharacterized protein n=1 Tax=Prunus dulcis TaxID=3755 RepID=A0A5H2XWJ7_PRUDU|nr:hypothetical protein Prudu_1437S000300 [Prunus dulcis]
MLAIKDLKAPSDNKRPTLGCESIVEDGGRIWFGVLDRGPFEEDDEFEKVKQTVGSVTPRY